MLRDSQKFKQALFFPLLLQLTFFTIMTLAGCGGSENIPSASIITNGEVTLTWEDVAGAATYNVYFSMRPDLTVLNSYKIPNVKKPITITDLKPGTTYYFVVTVEDDSGQSRKSKEISYTVVHPTGLIQFGEILSHSKPDAAVSEAKNVPTSFRSDSKPVAKRKPLKRQGASTNSSAEIVVCFGDSLTYGTGASKGMDYPSQLAKMIRKTIINKGLPGDTTARALRRLNRDVLSQNPDIVLITLGGNDLKNGVSSEIAFRNLKQIVQIIQIKGAKVIIGGLRFAGIDRGYSKGYEYLARQTGALLIPNVFAGIGNNPDLMSDPIHPNNSGYRILARNFYDAIASSEPLTEPAVKGSTPQTRDVTLAWDNVPNADSYNLYWSDKPGVTKKNGTKISSVKSPHKIAGLKKGQKYYIVVTAVEASAESKESKELSFTVGQ